MRKLLILLTCATVLFSCGNKDDEGHKSGKPQNDLYSEPILTFGASKETIREQEKRTLIEEDVNGLAYKDATYGVIYIFEEDKLISSSIVLPLNTDINKLRKNLSSKFVYLGTDEEYTFWHSESRNLVVGFYETPYGVIVMYMSRSAFTSPEKTPSIQRAPLADDMVVVKVKNAIDQLLK